MVVDGGMDGGELLQTSHVLDTFHGAFSSSECQARILGAVVEPPARSLFFERNQFSERSLAGSGAVGDFFLNLTLPLH